jgi:hypothetical protein
MGKVLLILKTAHIMQVILLMAKLLGKEFIYSRMDLYIKEILLIHTLMAMEL